MVCHYMQQLRLDDIASLLQESVVRLQTRNGSFKAH